jgi:hypothetical protein
MKNHPILKFLMMMVKWNYVKLLRNNMSGEIIEKPLPSIQWLILFFTVSYIFELNWKKVHSRTNWICSNIELKWVTIWKSYITLFNYFATHLKQLSKWFIDFPSKTFYSWMNESWNEEFWNWKIAKSGKKARENEEELGIWEIR